MTAGWIAIEIFINIIEECTVFYLLCSKFSAKYKTVIPTVLFLILTSIIMSLSLFVELDVIKSFKEIIATIVILFYLIILREGNTWRKVFWTFLCVALLFAISFLSITIISVINENSSLDIITESSNARFQNLILVHIIQIIVFYILSSRKKYIDKMQGISPLLCFIIPIICAVAGIIVYDIVLSDVGSNIPDILLYVVSLSYLIISIVVFALYERINKEAEKNYILMAKQKQYELTERHNQEVTKIYSQMREWRHDYANHMQAVLVLIEKTNDNDNVEAVNYIKKLDEKITLSSSTVSTGNYLADAIISAKMTLASSCDINFEYNASLPETLHIEDTDLCSILSNLLDNSIEACRRVEGNRYIRLELTLIKNQLHAEIINSSDGKYIRQGGKFMTTKSGAMHGIGLGHVKSIVDRYDGIYNAEAEQDFFKTQISIPLKERKSA